MAALCSNNPADHYDGDDCPCGPKRLHVLRDGTEVWLHRDADGEYPPADVQLWAIGVAASDEKEER